jgi:GntR family transcriptional regulator
MAMMLLKHVRGACRLGANRLSVNVKQTRHGSQLNLGSTMIDPSARRAHWAKSASSTAVTHRARHRDVGRRRLALEPERHQEVVQSCIDGWTTAVHCQNDMSGPRAPQIDVPDIRGDLEKRITQGEFAVGQRLPSESALASEYRSTRPRVRTALAALARRGLVVSRANAGWFVEAGRQAQNVNQIVSFSEWAKQHGRRFGGRIVGREHGPASAREARMFGIGLGAEIARFTRVRTLDERPVMVERSAWAPWACRVIDGLPDDTSSMFGALAEAGIRAFLGDHRIEAASASASNEDALLLGVRRSGPVLQVVRSSVTSERRVIEFATDRYLPDLVAFDVSGSSIARALLPHG